MSISISPTGFNTAHTQSQLLEILVDLIIIHVLVKYACRGTFTSIFQDTLGLYYVPVAHILLYCVFATKLHRVVESIAIKIEYLCANSITIR